MAPTNVDDEATGLISDGVVSGSNIMPRKLFSATFHIETLRMIAFINFVLVMIICSFLTKQYVEIPEDETVIYHIFGFNHACNVVDHHPAREVGSILILFFILPLAFFHVLSHYRTKYAVENRGLPSWLLTYSTVVTPYNFLATCYCYMWFVNNPDDTYGFIAHYIPYLTYQIMLALLAFHQVFYLVHMDPTRLPCGVKPWVAYFYAIFLAVLTVVYSAYVISILADRPIWDSVHNVGDRQFAQIMAKVYSVCTLFLPIAFAAIQRKNGDVHTISFG